MKAPHASHGDRDAFTLIESLLALAMALLILAVVYTSWNTALRITADWEQRTTCREREHSLLNQLSQDLTHLARTPDREDCDLILTPDGHVEGIVANHGSGEQLAGYTLRRVSYTLDEPGGALRRSVRGLNELEDASATPSTPHPTQVFSIQFFDGEKWKTEWNSSESGWPQAAKIQLQVGEGALQEALVWIPVGQSFLPTPP